MEGNQIQTYLRTLEYQLWLRGLADADILAEIQSHLLEAVEAGLHQGMSPEVAEQKALERFGSVKIVVRTFESERKTLMQKILLVVAVVAGLFFAYVDALPNWDDSGILAGGLLFISGLLTLLGHRKPWLIALAVGLWIPLHDIYLSHDFSLILIVLFPLVGAYAGWAVHLGIRKTFHPV